MFHLLRKYLLLTGLLAIILIIVNINKVYTSSEGITSDFPIIIFNDSILEFESLLPEYQGGELFIPLKEYMEGIGGVVTWDESDKTISVSKNNKSIKINFRNKKILYIDLNEEYSIDINTINGKSFIPISLITTYLGFEISTTDGTNSGVKIVRILSGDKTYISNNDLEIVFTAKIQAHIYKVKDYMEEKNMFEPKFNNENITLKQWEQIGDRLKVYVNEPKVRGQKYKIKWRILNDDKNSWDIGNSGDFTCPYWYSWPSGDNRLYARIDNGHIEKEISTIIHVEAPKKNIEEKKNQKVVYITIDDGPSTYTESILNILDTYGFKATFFMLSYNMITYKSEIQKINEKGHTLALHGATHIYSQVYRDDYSVSQSMIKANDVLESIIGYRTSICRVPYGSVSGMTKRQLQNLKLNGYNLWDWNIDSGDTKRVSVDPDVIFNSTINQMRNFKECFILIHEKRTSVQALSKLCKYIQNNGYIEKPITTDMKGRNFIEGSI